MNPAYAEYLTGKTVAVVAPGRSVEGKGWGSEIDSFDIVVRLNRGFPIPPELIPDIGSRTDVLYHLMVVGIAGTEKEFSQCIGKMKWIIATRPDANGAVQKFRDHINRGRIPFDAIPQELFAHVKRMIRKIPNTGILTIGHLLGHKITRLKLYGFTFYRDGYHIGYGGRDRKESEKMVGGQRGHDQPSQMRLLKSWIEKDPRIETDPVLGEILKQVTDPPVPRNREETVKLRAKRNLAGTEGMVYRGDIFFATPKRAKLLIDKQKADPVNTEGQLWNA